MDDLVFMSVPGTPAWMAFDASLIGNDKREGARGPRMMSAPNRTRLPPTPALASTAYTDSG